MAEQGIAPLEKITECNVHEYHTRLSDAAAALKKFLPHHRAELMTEHLESFIDTLHDLTRTWCSARIRPHTHEVKEGWHVVTLSSEPPCLLQVEDGTSYRQFLQWVADKTDRFPLLLQLYIKTEMEFPSSKGQLAYELIDDLSSPVCAGTYVLKAAGPPGTSREGLLDALKCWKPFEHGQASIYWLCEYFLRIEKFSQLLLFADMQPVIELLDGCCYPDGYGIWQTRRGKDDHIRVWPDYDGGPAVQPHRQPLPGRQLRCMVLEGAVLHQQKKPEDIVRLVNTDKTMVADLQGLEETVGIPVTPIPAFSQRIECSLKDKLERFKPRWLVFLGEGSEDAWFYVAKHNTHYIPWWKLAHIIVEHNRRFPHEPVLLVLALACHGGRGLKRLMQDGIHVIGWDSRVRNSHAVKYATGLLKYLQERADGIECGEGIDLAELFREAHAAMWKEGAPDLHWSGN